MKHLFILIFILAICSFSFAQPGSLDASFGSHGKVTTDFQNHHDSHGNAIARQSDGKIILAGNYTNINNISVPAMVRYNTDGTLDNGFGVSGQVFTDFPGTINAIAIQSNGNIIVAGDYNGDFMTVRFNSGGYLDNTFGSEGIVLTDIGSDYDYANAVVVQSDGKIVVVGQTGIVAQQKLVAIRYNIDGTLDNSFNKNGEVLMQGHVNEPAAAESVAIQSDGKIVTAGYTERVGQGIGDNDFLVIRYNSNGTVDKSFNGSGVVITTIDVGEKNNARSVKIQSDGKIVVGGDESNTSGMQRSNFVVVRYNANGSLDNTFSLDGISTTPFLPDPHGFAYGYVTSLAIQSDGKLVLSGYSEDANVILARFTSNGILDNTFTSDGKVLTVTSAFEYVSAGSIIQPDNSIIIGGTSITSSLSSRSFFVTSYNTDGSINTAFQSTGLVKTQLGIFDDEAFASAVQSDGKVIVAGYSYSPDWTASTSAFNAPSSYKLAMTRYLSTGVPDSTFNSTGKLFKKYSGDFHAFAVKVQADGKIVAAGSIYNGTDFDFAVVRLKANGTADNTFSGDGLASISFGKSTDIARCMAIQADGKIVVAGATSQANGDDFAIARYNTNGALDNTFGTGGKIIKDLAHNHDDIASIAIQSDGKIVVAGYTYNGSYHNVVMMRFNSNGTPDNTFGVNGIVTTAIGTNNIYGFSVALQSNGKIIVGGKAYTGAIANLLLLRYTSNGTLDNSFAGGGIVTTSVAGGTDFGNSVAIESNGLILLGGQSFTSGFTDFGLVRYKSTGIVDSSFGTNGRVHTDFNGGAEAGYSVSLQPDGKIIMAGYTTGHNFAVARYISGVKGLNSDNFAYGSIDPFLSDGLLKATIAPNPANVFSKLIITSSSKLPVYVEIFDNSGRSVVPRKLMLSNVFDLPVSKLPTGIYNVIVQQGGLSTQAKVIVEEK